MLPTFSKNNPLRAAQINEELRRTEFDGAFRKKFQFLIDRSSSCFRPSALSLFILLLSALVP